MVSAIAVSGSLTCHQHIIHAASGGALTAVLVFATLVGPWKPAMKKEGKTEIECPMRRQIRDFNKFCRMSFIPRFEMMSSTAFTKLTRRQPGSV
jgi:hypothetical protein